MSDRQQEKDLSLPEADDQKVNRRAVSPSQSSEHQEDHQESFVAYVSRTFLERSGLLPKESSEEPQEVQQ